MWFTNVITGVCVATVLGMLFSTVEGGGGIFKCVRLVISLVLSLYVISICLNADFSFLENIKAEKFKINTPKYSDGILKSYNKKIEEEIIKEIENVYSDAQAEVYVISEIDDEYKINIISLSVTVKAGDINKILNIVHKNTGIEKEKILIQRE